MIDMEQHNGFTVMMAVIILATVSLVSVCVWYLFPVRSTLPEPQATVSLPPTDIEKIAILVELQAQGSAPVATKEVRLAEIKRLRSQSSSTRSSVSEDEKLRILRELQVRDN